MKQTKTVFSHYPTNVGNASGSYTGAAVDCREWETAKSVVVQSSGGSTLALSNIVVQGSNDNSSWTNLGVSGGVNFSAGLTSHEVGYLSGRLDYRYLRHHFTASGTGQFCSYFELGEGANQPTTAAAHGASGYFAGNF